MNKRIKVILLILLIGFFLLPIRVMCGGFGKSCTTAPDEKGYIHRTVVYRPLLVVFIDTVLGVDLPFEYRRERSSEYIGK